MPPNMKEWLPVDHLAWFLIDAVGQMDLSAFHAAHRTDGKGQKAHHPEMMLTVLLYAYCQGERSSRIAWRAYRTGFWRRTPRQITAPSRVSASGTRRR
ncbi:MAG: transposase [Planctomycetota bacterium]|jgi:hypothetical protein